MFPRIGKRSATKAKTAVTLKTNIDPYLPRLYVESRHILFRILLGQTLPAQTPFPVDPAETAEIVRQIEALILHDEHLEGCRGKIEQHFPGRLAVLFNLAKDTDKLYPTEELRASIRNHVRRHQADLSGAPLDAADQEAMEQLKGSSRLQQQLAYLVDYTPNKWLLEQEIPVVLESRRRRIKAAAATPPRAAVASGSSAATSVARESFSRADDAYLWSRDKGRLSGLCFSGGGIRSATFNLGILQGLASKNLLRRFDYCASVSGGGYIHQWLAAWVKREEAQYPAATDSPGLDTVCRQLIPLPDAGCGPRPAEPIRWLRRYSNYLTPKTGILSADTWVTAATWLRNTFLNQIILISCLLSVLLLPHLFLLPQISSALAPISASAPAAPGLQSAAGISKAALLIILVAINYLILVRNLAAGLNDARKGRTCDSRFNDRDLCLLVVLPSLFISVAVCDFGFYFNVPGLSEVQHAVGLCVFSFVGLFILSWVLTWAGGAFEKRPSEEGDSRYRRVIGFTLAAVLSALAGTGGILLTRNAFVSGNPFSFDPPAIRVSAPPANPNVNVQVNTGDSQQMSVLLQVTKAAGTSAVAPPRHKEAEARWRSVVTFGPVIVMVIPFIAIILQSGLVGYDFPDWVLEWLARVRAWVAMYSVAWTLLVGLSLFGHQIVDYILLHGNKWISGMGVGSWLLTTIGSVLAGKSSKTSGEAGSNGNSPQLNLLIAVGPPVYILGLLLMLAWAAQEALELAGISNRQELSALQMSVALGVVLLGPVATFLLFGWRVDINEFSMHSYYRNRLARCYLGASNTARDPDPLTGFDNADVDGLRLSTFLPNQGYTGPMPVFCATINISVGEDLAWQERKAASFAFTPLLSGYHVPWTGRHYKGQLSYNGFVPTERFAYGNGGIHISTVVAISGAAISPNAGYHTNKAMAFLLTMFNVRLGWWLPNPRRSFLAFDPKGQAPPGAKAYPHPAFAPNQLLSELLGQIGDDRKFVYLTDGGHFDNMGLYEMVRRRCYEIVICDAEQDAGPVFEGIGMAIRKCRIDFGVEIDLDLNKLATDAATKVSKVHWILGSIKYPETGDAEPGTILYIKSSITGNEAADVYNYRLQHAPFPQDSTLDQWFTESQFESYRRLGQQVVDVCPYL